MGPLTLVAVIIMALPAYRIAQVVAVDKIGEPLRQYLYRHQQSWKGGRWLHSLITCPFCCSVWFSAVAVAVWIWLILPGWPGIGVFLFAIGAVAGAARLMVSLDMAVHVYIEK